MKRFSMLCAASLVACGGSTPPPKAEAPVEASHGPTAPLPVMQQELGSIDEDGVKQTFNKLQDQLGKCQAQGRDRVEYLAGDVKVFLRIDASGKVRYGYFEESSLGDRDTEKCIMDAFKAAQWPRPVGGEAEVRNGFGFDPAGERPPTSWGPEKVTMAIDDSKEVKKELRKCKADGVRVTGYVVHDEGSGDEHAAPPSGKKKNGHGKASAKEEKKHGGKFQAIGVAAPSKELAEKLDCVVDALKDLKLPSPGSYAAKVSFTL
jgi:hypothetical protein